MDKSAIKNYAISARRKLIEAVSQKAFALGIYEDSNLSAAEAARRLMADGVFLTPDQQNARQRLVDDIDTQAHDLSRKGAYRHVMEEVAYTWFNRLIALRFMEVNGYLPSGIRVLSSLDQGRAEPDALRQAEILDYVEQAKVTALKIDTSYVAAEKLYKYILVSQCSALYSILPGMFEPLGDYTELLLPDNLYAKGGIVHDLISAVSEEDFRDQVQIIGWLYQYYISEKKDEVFAALKNNVKITKETIPAATQLFTPEWIVKYMVENSLGRLWLESSLSGGKSAADFGWMYYVEEAAQEPEVTRQLQALRAQSPIKRPEDIKLIDPCMGSGHILAYAFDVLCQIYQSRGYAERDIPNLILDNNIYGLDIDRRAGQLAYFALMMKARGASPRFFKQERIPQPMVYAFVETDGAQKQHLELMGQSMTPGERQWRKDEMEYLMELFVDAREYGSILKIERQLDYNALQRYVKDCKLGQVGWAEQGMAHTQEILLKILDLAETLARKYHISFTNPPYLSARGGMSVSLTKYLQMNYPYSKNDLFTVFMEICINLLYPNGYISMINQQSWMFLSGFSALRQYLYDNTTMQSLLHIGAGAFEGIAGEVVQSVAFSLKKAQMHNYLASYYKLDNGVWRSCISGIANQNAPYNVSISTLKKIPNGVLCYWLGEKSLRQFYAGQRLDMFSDPRVGLATGENGRFVRLWHEIDFTSLGFGFSSGLETIDTEYKWYPYNKGGEYRRWYGNRECVVNWGENGRDITNYKQERLLRGEIEKKNSECWNREYYFKESVSWSKVSSSRFAARYYEKGFIFDVAGCSILGLEENIYYFLGALNSQLRYCFIEALSPTLNFETGAIKSFPIIADSGKKEQIDNLVKYCIRVEKFDWDSFETSWDFQRHPLVSHQVRGSYNAQPSGDKAYIETSFKLWQMEAQQCFDQLKANEEELNRIFIDIYGLQNELTTQVEDKDVTVRRADLGRDIRSFVSYAVGCMFGRYSLNEPGLIYAGGSFDASRYQTYLPEPDNIIPIGSADWFDDDIVVRFADFVKAVYGESSLGENLEFIAGALYPNASGTAREKIRRYFLNDFYKDHVKVYQKRPIYWLLDSGKQNGFKALIYLHRYDHYTIARVRTDYLLPLQHKYEAEIHQQEMIMATSNNPREQAGCKKEIEALRGKASECIVYDQVVSHIAHKQIDLDLDDGVTTNYAKFQGVEVPKGGGRTEKLDLFARF